MNTLKTIVKSGASKRLLLTLLSIAVIAALFWTGSRYPALNEKALMGGDTMIESPLSFDAVFPVQENYSVVKQIAYTATNWAAENKKGMAFGIGLGAAFLTLLNLLSNRGTKNGLLNTLIGIGTGAPLGVCANCAAPIAKGMHDAGARLETTLAAMFSSPTLNIVILTMLIAIFPLYLVVIKLAMTLFFIVILIPLMTRVFLKEERVSTYDDNICLLPLEEFIAPDEKWTKAIWETSKNLIINLWYIVKKTVPLMILAGVLGATAVTLIPMDSLQAIPTSFMIGLLVAAIGVFLPVPIALDLIISASLLASGVPVFYVMIMLFTLGIYSIYPFLIIWKSISFRCALTLAVAIFALGILSGYIAEYYYQYDLQKMYEYIDAPS